MQIKLRDINSIFPYEGNPRINDNAVDAVTASLREFGFRQPIVVDADCVIIVGHVRYKAAVKLGLQKVPVHVATDLSPEQIKAYRIADNKTAELAEWDFDKLKAELEELVDFDMTLFGFDDAEYMSNDEEHTPKAGTFKEKFSVVVDCTDEEQQRIVYELLAEHGYEPRIISL